MISTEILALDRAQHVAPPLLELPPPARRRELRERAGLPPEAIALIAGVTTRQVQRWETGESTPEGQRAVAYRRCLAALSADGLTSGLTRVERNRLTAACAAHDGTASGIDC
jgi:DNA-binding transcriptional regulator YiaG